MPAGAAQRVWYPEMLVELERFWSPDLPWHEVIAFCDRMTVMRKELAVAKGIKPATIKCPKCGKRHTNAYPIISVRSLIFALNKAQIISDDELKSIDIDWKRYKRKHSLTATGKEKR